MLPNCSQPLPNGYIGSRGAYQRHEIQGQRQLQQSYFQENGNQSTSFRMEQNRQYYGNTDERIEQQIFSPAQTQQPLKTPQSSNVQHFNQNQQIMQAKHTKNTKIHQSDGQSNSGQLPYFCEESFSEDSNCVIDQEQKKDNSKHKNHLNSLAKSQYSNSNNHEMKARSQYEQNNDHEFQSQQHQFNLDQDNYNINTKNIKIQKKKKVLAIITLQIGQGTDEIRVFQGDDIATLAEQFCIRHQLESECYIQIANIIQENLQSKLQEMRSQRIQSQLQQSAERSTSCTSSQREDEQQIDDPSRNQKLNSNINTKMTFYQKQLNKHGMTDQLEFQQQQQQCMTNSVERKNSESPKFPNVPQAVQQEQIRIQQPIKHYQQHSKNANKRRQQQPSFGQMQFFEASSTSPEGYSPDVVGNHLEKEEIEQIAEGEESSEESSSSYHHHTMTANQSNVYDAREYEQYQENEYSSQHIRDDQMYQRESNNRLNSQYHNNNKMNDRAQQQNNEQGLVDKKSDNPKNQHKYFQGQSDQENEVDYNKSSNKMNTNNFNKKNHNQQEYFDEEQEEIQGQDNMVESAVDQGDDITDELLHLEKQQQQLGKSQNIQRQSTQEDQFHSDANSYSQDLKQLKNTTMQKVIPNLNRNSHSNFIPPDTISNLPSKLHQLSQQSLKSSQQQQHAQLPHHSQQLTELIPNHHDSSCVGDVSNSTNAEPNKRQESEAQKSYDAWMQLLSQKIANSSQHRIKRSPNKAPLTPQKINQLLGNNQSKKQLSNTPNKNTLTFYNKNCHNKHLADFHSQSNYSNSSDSQGVLSQSAAIAAVSLQQNYSTQSAQTNIPSADYKLFDLSPRTLAKGQSSQSQRSLIKNNQALIQQPTTHRTRVAASGSKDRQVNTTPSKKMQRPQTHRDQINGYLESLGAKAKEIRISQTRGNNQSFISCSTNAGELTPRRKNNISTKAGTEQSLILQRKRNNTDKSIPYVDLRKSQNTHSQGINVLNNSTNKLVIPQNSYRQATPNGQLKTLAEFENTYTPSSPCIGAPPLSSRQCVTPLKDIQNTQFTQANIKPSQKQQYFRPPNNEKLSHSPPPFANRKMITPKKQQHNLSNEKYFQSPGKALLPQSNFQQIKQIKKPQGNTQQLQHNLLSELSSKNLIIPSHLKAFNNMSLQRKLAQLFSSLDSDNDGIINSTQIDISNIDAALLVIIQNALYEIEEHSLTLNQLEFIDLLQQHDLFLELKKYYAEIEGQFCDDHDGGEDIKQQSNIGLNKSAGTIEIDNRNQQFNQKNSKVNRTNIVTNDTQTTTTSNQFQPNKENLYSEGTTTQTNSYYNNQSNLSSGNCSIPKSQQLSEQQKSKQIQQFQNFPQERYYTQL